MAQNNRCRMPASVSALDALKPAAVLAAGALRYLTVGVVAGPWIALCRCSGRTQQEAAWVVSRSVRWDVVVPDLRSLVQASTVVVALLKEVPEQLS